VLGQLTDQIKRENRIPVPRYFFMALLSKKGNNYKATAFWVEHLNEDHTNDALRNYAYSIDWLEQQTGIDFFCNLPDDIEDMVESKMTPSEWGLK
jgi:endonuclease G